MCTDYFSNYLLFVYGSAGSSLLCGLFSGCEARAPHHGGFSCFGAQDLGGQASVAVARGLTLCTGKP